MVTQSKLWMWPVSTEADWFALVSAGPHWSGLFSATLANSPMCVYLQRDKVMRKSSLQLRFQCSFFPKYKPEFRESTIAICRSFHGVKHISRNSCKISSRGNPPWGGGIYTCKAHTISCINLHLPFRVVVLFFSLNTFSPFKRNTAFSLKANWSRDPARHVRFTWPFYFGLFHCRFYCDI